MVEEVFNFQGLRFQGGKAATDDTDKTDGTDSIGKRVGMKSIS
jgi:hypothetical protein